MVCGEAPSSKESQSFLSAYASGLSNKGIAKRRQMKAREVIMKCLDVKTYRVLSKTEFQTLAILETSQKIFDDIVIECDRNCLRGNGRAVFVKRANAFQVEARVGNFKRRHYDNEEGFIRGKGVSGKGTRV
jgi:hypothetical protein